MPQRLALPIRVTATGALASVPQDSDAEIRQSLGLLVATVPGERRSEPDYGLPDPTFGGVDVTEIADVIATWEPRADPSVIEVAAVRVVDGSFTQVADIYTPSVTTDPEV